MDDENLQRFPPAKERKSASHGEAGYERRPRDAYFTEPWVTRALVGAVDFVPLMPGMVRNETVVWEPACGDGRMARVLSAAGYRVFASDVHYYGWPSTQDSLLSEMPGGNEPLDFLRDFAPIVPDAIVTNPPFDLARQFLVRALELTRPRQGKVAILQRHEFDAPKINHPLFEPPFAAKLVLHKRPRWVDGPESASPRFPYAWYVWDWRHDGPPVLRYLPDPDCRSNRCLEEFDGRAPHASRRPEI